MFQRILVPLDGSTRAERALPVAAHLARKAGGSIVLAIVVNHFVLTEHVQPYYGPESEEEMMSLHDAETYLQKIAQKIANAPEYVDLSVETLILSGPVASSLIAACRTHQIDLMVLCSHGSSNIKSRLLGSNAEKIVQRAPVPVLLLRDEHASDSLIAGGTSHALRVLVAIDGSSFSDIALEPAGDLAIALSDEGHAGLHLVRVVLPRAVVQQQHMYGSQAASTELAQTCLANIASCLSEGKKDIDLPIPRLDVTWSVVESDQIASTLVHIANQILCPTMLRYPIMMYIQPAM